MNEVKLGDKVRDSVTKFEGVALAKMEALFGATQFRIHRDSLKPDGEIQAGVWIDAGRLEVLDAPRMIGFKNVPPAKV
jgi:hypothetical protein